MSRNRLEALFSNQPVSRRSIIELAAMLPTAAAAGIILQADTQTVPTTKGKDRDHIYQVGESFETTAGTIALQGWTIDVAVKHGIDFLQAYPDASFSFTVNTNKASAYTPALNITNTEIGQSYGTQDCEAVVGERSLFRMVVLPGNTSEIGVISTWGETNTGKPITPQEYPFVVDPGITYANTNSVPLFTSEVYLSKPAQTAIATTIFDFSLGVANQLYVVDTPGAFRFSEANRGSITHVTVDEFENPQFEHEGELRLAESRLQTALDEPFVNFTEAQKDAMKAYVNVHDQVIANIRARSGVSFGSTVFDDALRIFDAYALVPNAPKPPRERAVNQKLFLFSSAVATMYYYPDEFAEKYHSLSPVEQDDVHNLANETAFLFANLVANDNARVTGSLYDLINTLPQPEVPRQTY